MPDPYPAVELRRRRVLLADNNDAMFIRACRFPNGGRTDRRFVLSANHTGRRRAKTTVAPAATARSKATSGSSTVMTIRTEPAAERLRLKLACSGDSSATQNSAVPTDNRATTRSAFVVHAKQFAGSGKPTYRTRWLWFRSEPRAWGDSGHESIPSGRVFCAAEYHDARAVGKSFAPA